VNFIASGLVFFGADYFFMSIEANSTEEYIKVVAISVLILGILNTFIRPILKLISLPFLFLTFGIFAIFINAFIFLVLTIVIPEINIHVFWGYFVIPVVLGIFNWLLHLFISDKKK
jgi:putative membrane protein